MPQNEQMNAISGLGESEEAEAEAVFDQHL